MHFPAEEVDSSGKTSEHARHMKLRTFEGVFKAQILFHNCLSWLARVLASHKSVKSKSNLVGRFYGEGPTFGLHPHKLVPRP